MSNPGLPTKFFQQPRWD